MIVVRETVYFGSVKVDEDVVATIDTVLVSGSGDAFALEVPATDQTGVDVVGGKRHATDGLEVEVDQMAFDGGVIGTLLSDMLLFYCFLHLL